jgi:hypothetical protein
VHEVLDDGGGIKVSGNGGEKVSGLLLPPCSSIFFE